MDIDNMITVTRSIDRSVLRAEELLGDQLLEKEQQLHSVCAGRAVVRHELDVMISCLRQQAHLCAQ
jgi:hypothetical protein